MLQIAGNTDMFIKKENIYEEIKKYAQNIAERFKVQIEFIFIIIEQGYIAYPNEKRESNIEIIPKTTKADYIVLISKDKNEKYNLITTEIQYFYKNDIVYKIFED